MRSFEPTMSAQIDVFLRLHLESCEDDQVVDLTQRCKRLATDIIGHLAFGFPFKTQTEEGHRYLIDIIDAMSSASEIQAGARLSSCKYLRACIDEALRMSPPTLTPLWRQQDIKDRSGQPFVVDGHVIPRGTQVAVSLYSLLHNEEYFPDAFAFKTERWLGAPPGSEGDVAEEHNASLASMRKAFVPFLVGDRSCAGKAMAYLETSLTFARTLWYFDFEVAPGAAGEVGAG